jgi:hypothetical protein
MQREVDTEDGKRMVRATSVRVDLDLTPEGGLQAAQHHTPEYVHQRRYLGHPNGALRLDKVLVVVPDDDVDAYVDRYRRIVPVTAQTDGPMRVLPLRVGGIAIIPASAADEALPGHRLPTLPLIAAHTVAVADRDDSSKATASRPTTAQAGSSPPPRTRAGSHSVSSISQARPVVGRTPTSVPARQLQLLRENRCWCVSGVTPAAGGAAPSERVEPAGPADLDLREGVDDAADVPAHGGLGGLGVARAERLDDLEVLREGDRGPAGVHRQLELMADALAAQPLEDRVRGGLSGQLEDEPVEPPVQLRVAEQVT